MHTGRLFTVTHLQIQMAIRYKYHLQQDTPLNTVNIRQSTVLCTTYSLRNAQEAYHVLETFSSSTFGLNFRYCDEY